VSELAVVFVAFEGVQPIDVVGPHEVFADAGDAAASLGRHAGYRVQVASARGGLGSAESLRRVFHRHLGVSPDAYRRRFRTTTRHEGAPA
jgi:putative intracellular protease/amidase